MLKDKKEKEIKNNKEIIKLIKEHKNAVLIIQKQQEILIGGTTKDTQK